MIASLPLVLTAVLMGPVMFFIYKFILFLLGVRRRGKAVDQFPGEPRHWLWGHIHLVSESVVFILLCFYCEKKLHLLRQEPKYNFV